MEISNLEWFKEGFFTFPNVPENTASGEIIIGSLYRELGLAYAKEGEVGEFSKELKNKIKKGYNANNVKSPSDIPINNLEYIFEILVSSPILKTQNQKKNNEYYFFSPIVPNFANYSNVARLNSQPWNPGSYLIKMIYRGSGNKTQIILDCLKSALSINEDSTNGVKDDIWSRFVAAEITAWEKDFIITGVESKTKDDCIRLEVVCPSQRLSKDIVYLIRLKSLMTRKRWVSILEAYLRFILALDVLWICHIQHYFSEWIEKAYSNDTFEYIEEDLAKYSFFTIGQKRDDVVNYFSKEYAKNSLLNNGIEEYAKLKKVELQQPFNVQELIAFLTSFRKKIAKKDFLLQREKILSYIDVNKMNEITGRKGRINNISEFLKYAPGRRNTAKESQSSYDQGYWYKKVGEYKSAQWVFEMGPASLVTMVYLSCAYYEAITISVLDFIEFMKVYGIQLNQKEVAYGITGKQLRMLGLIMDSPDSEGGIVINQPFKF